MSGHIFLQAGHHIRNKKPIFAKPPADLWNMDEELDLIQQLKEGREEAYRCLYERHYAVLCHAARGWVGDDYTAEALVGDVIFHLWEIRESLEIRVSLRSYLLQAVRNRCLDHLSSRHERTEVTFSMLDEEGGPPLSERYALSDSYPLGRLLEQELETQIRQAIASLPADCRTVFRKSRFEGKKYEEIAAELGISVNTVKYHIKNALARLHERLAQYLSAFLIFFSLGN